MTFEQMRIVRTCVKARRTLLKIKLVQLEKSIEWIPGCFPREDETGALHKEWEYLVGKVEEYDEILTEIDNMQVKFEPEVSVRFRGKK